MNIIIINPPVYTATTFPYSLAAMKAELKTQIDENIKVLDLNSKFHYLEFQNYYQDLKNNPKSYFKLLEQFYKEAKNKYSLYSKLAIKNKSDDLPRIQELIETIKIEKPDVLAISVTYNSQIFYTKVIIEKIQKILPTVKIVIGGPAYYSKIITTLENPPLVLANANSFATFLVTNGAKKLEANNLETNNQEKIIIPDFSDFNKEEYFTTDIVFPLRTSHSCPYQRCSFCTHHGNNNYQQFDLNFLKETIQKNNIKKICFIDDDLTAKRILEISEILKDQNVIWWCQLRPIKQIQNSLKIAYESGLRSVAWGLESGNQRILDLIEKGTNVKDITETLKIAKELSINNMLYVLFGFPTETYEEFLDTINFLKKNQENIDLVSPSIFGLQFGSKIMKQPSDFSVANIQFESRTLLSDKISYQTTKGQSQSEVKKLYKENKHTLNRINKVPGVISVFKEQVLNYKQ